MRSFTGPSSQYIIEITFRSGAIASPIAATEEVWKLRRELPAARIPAVLLTSLIVVKIFAFVLHRRSDEMPCGKDFRHRITKVYVFTLLVWAGFLPMFDWHPVLTDPSTAINRTRRVAFPASFSAADVECLS